MYIYIQFLNVFSFFFEKKEKKGKKEKKEKRMTTNEVILNEHTHIRVWHTPLENQSHEINEQTKKRELKKK